MITDQSSIDNILQGVVFFATDSQIYSERKFQTIIFSDFLLFLHNPHLNTSHL